LQDRELRVVRKDDANDCPYAAGDMIPDSGIYELCHQDKHNTTVVLIRGGVFPECACCGVNARFRLVRAAPYLMEDPDFRDPGPM
jgi:hypothetical protein